MTEPTATGFVEEFVVHDDAEDVKTIEVRGERVTVSFSVTDESMLEFVEVSEQVFTDIHDDMAELRDLLERDIDDSAE